MKRDCSLGQRESCKADLLTHITTARITDKTVQNIHTTTFEKTAVIKNHHKWRVVGRDVRKVAISVGRISTVCWSNVGNFSKSFTNGRIGKRRTGKWVEKDTWSVPSNLKRFWAGFWTENDWTTVGILLANGQFAKRGQADNFYYSPTWNKN